MKLGREHPTFRKDLGCRIEKVVDRFPSKAAAADAAGVTVVQLNKWIAGTVKVPIEGLHALSLTSDANFSWLATGEQPGGHNHDALQENGKFIGIPRYAARLAAGDGALNIEDAPVLDHIPFTPEFLAKRLGKTQASGLMILTADGDSMDPTISDGDLVMIDQRVNNVTEGIYAFVINGMARVKRLRETIAGDIEIISDNSAYEKETLNSEEAHDFQLLGKVVWCGHHFAR